MRRTRRRPVASERPSNHASRTDRWEGRAFGLLLWLGVHAGLGLLLGAVPLAATIHAASVVGAGMWLALARPPAVALYAAAYVATSDVLWRMTDAAVPWEFGKYGVIAILGLSLLVRGDWRRFPQSAGLYIAALLPSGLLTLAHPGVADPRDALVFNLSGPLTLTVTVVACSIHRFTPRQITKAVLTGVGPLIAITAVTLQSTYGAAGPIEFTSRSNLVTSGGFGPNQVATVLGLGGLLTFLLMVTGRVRGRNSVLAAAACGVLLVQSAMTFSRGGLYAAAAAGLLGALYLMRDARARARLVTGAGVAALIAYLIVLPLLEDFTGGALQERFQDTTTTGRWEILVADLRLAFENPLLGVGPGVSGHERASGEAIVAAHTEVSRLLAEHGLFGILALLFLAQLALRTIRMARTPRDRAMVAGLIAWSVVTMLHSAMRVSATGFIFGFAVAAAGASRFRPWAPPAGGSIRSTPYPGRPDLVRHPGSSSDPGPVPTTGGAK